MQPRLPHADRGLAGVGHDGHRAQLHHLHRGDDHLAPAAVAASTVAGRVLHREVHRPGVGRAGLAVVAHAPGDEHVVLREVDVTAVLLAGRL